MPNDKYYNKVVWDNQTLIDLTRDTVTAGDLRYGVTAHGANGQLLTGTASFSQVQVDWNQTDTTAVDYIKNKPSIINTAKLLGNWYKPEGGYASDARPTSANMHSGNTGGVKTFLATSSMTTGKPSQDGNILHFEWDNGARYSSQFAMPHGAAPQYRHQTGAGDTASDWTEWYTLYSTGNKPSWSDISSKPNRAGSDSDGGPAQTVKGSYSGSGGVQPPNYFGTNKVGFLMSNVTVNSDSHYKNIMYMDCYSGNDVGGVTALALDRTEARAFILQSASGRTSWANSTELVTHAQCATTATASTIAKRDANGYLFCTYLNTSNSREDTSFQPTHLVYFNNGSDGYLRKMYAATLARTFGKYYLYHERKMGTIVSSDNRVIIDEGYYVIYGCGETITESSAQSMALCTVTMRVHASADTSTRIYFCNQIPKPVAPVGIIPISYNTGKTANAAWYYIGTNGQGISNTGTIYKSEPHCINVTYVTAIV